MTILYASFLTPDSAEKAAAALIDRGADSNDISFLADPSYEGTRKSLHEERLAKTGITTTTGADALMGATKGITVGTGLGIIGAVAALAVPGFGLVIGAGAFAAAAAAAAGTAVAGAAAGGVYGYLKDQGLSEAQVSSFRDSFSAGGAILSVNVPTGSLPEDQTEGILTKFGAVTVSSVNPRTTIATGTVVTEENPAYFDLPETTAHIPQVATPVNAVIPTLIDSTTGTVVEGYVLDEVSGIKRPVRVHDGLVTYVS